MSACTGLAFYLVGAFKARKYVDRNALASTCVRIKGMRGMAWVVLAACGALQVFTSAEVLTRFRDKDAELAQRRALVRALDNKIRVYRQGLKDLQTTVAHVRGNPEADPAATLIADIERTLGQITERERRMR